MWSLLPYGSSPPDTAEFVYGSGVVYFAQPSPSQFVPGGSGAGTFNINQSVSTSLKSSPNDAPALAGRSSLKNDTGVVLRCAPPAR